MKNLKFGMLFFTLLNLSHVALAQEVFRNFSQSRFDSGLNFNYFKTEANFASNGEQQSLPSGYSLMVLDTSITARYVLLEDFGLYGGLNIASSESSDVLATRRNSTLNFVTLGADYLFYQSRQFSLYAEISYRHAVEKIAMNTDSALNSDGASEVHAAVTALFDLGAIQPFASGGMTYRMEGLSTLLTYSVGVQTSFSPWTFGGALNGFISVVDDSKTSTPAERELVTNRVSASSKKFYSINPNLLDSDVYLKYIFNSTFSITARAGYTLMGSNSAQGYHIGAGITWGFGGDHYEKYSKPTHNLPSAPQPIAPKQITRPVQPLPQKPVKKFQEDTSDGVNQDYFKPVTPSQDPYVDKVEDLPSVQEEEDGFQIKSKKAPPSASGPGENEYQIKLKKTKKRK